MAPHLHRPLSPEPRRDWAFGFITGHRVRVIAYLALTITGLYYLQEWIWPNPSKPVGLFGEIWSWLSLLWLGAFIPGTLGLFGMLSYRFPTDLDEVKPVNRLVSWRIVSSGKNIDIVQQTIDRCHREMAATPLFPYIIEVVLDHFENVHHLKADDPRLRVILVPEDYVTPKHTRFKARALHYALLHSPLPDDAWIVHLDEETQPTPSGIKGICKAIAEEEASGKLRIGQGGLLYHRQFEKFPIMTLADNVRTGDDFARFFFQHKLGITIFGIHGSYVLVRNDVQKKSGGFDFGPQGDVTEDAYWAVHCMEKGVRCRWVDGYLEEQSTDSIGDFLRQRARWFQGLIKVALFAPVKLRWRLTIGINTALWAIAPLAMIYTFLHFFYGFEVRPWIRFLANYCYGTFLVLYLVGLRANMDEHGITSFWQRAKWTILQVVMLPFFSAIESTGVLKAMIRPPHGFDVVKK